MCNNITLNINELNNQSSNEKYPIFFPSYLFIKEEPKKKSTIVKNNNINQPYSKPLLKNNNMFFMRKF